MGPSCSTRRCSAAMAWSFRLFLAASELSRALAGALDMHPFVVWSTCLLVCRPQVKSNFSRTLSMPFGPALNYRMASAVVVSTVFKDANSVFGHRFQTRAFNDSLAFCVCILQQRSRRSALPSLLYSGHSSVTIALLNAGWWACAVDGFLAASNAWCLL